MNEIITNIREFESETYEIRYYEKGMWQIDTLVNDREEAIERMNYLIKEYECHANEVAAAKITHFENITKEMPF